MSRRRLATLAIVLGSLIGSTLAFGDFTFEPIQKFFMDDVALKFGNTEASPDVSVLWETADADNHYMNAVVTGSSDFVISQDSGVDWGSTGANALRVQSADSTATSEYAAMKHDGTDAHFYGGAGDLKINSANNVIIASTATYPIQLGDTDRSAVGFVKQEGGATLNEWANSGGVALSIATNAGYDQNLLGVDPDGGGRQLVFSTRDNDGIDHGHPEQTDPTLFIHSATDPSGGDATQWMSLSHDQTDSLIESGKGGINLKTADPESAGSGVGNAASLTTRIARVNGEVVTTILIDIQGLVESGYNNKVIGDSDEANAYFAKLTSAKNGLIYKAEIACLEAPGTGNADINIIVHDTCTLTEGAAATSGTYEVLLDSGGSHALGRLLYTASGTTTTNAVTSAAERCVYLATGAMGSSSDKTYSAGKFIITTYGSSI